MSEQDIAVIGTVAMFLPIIFVLGLVMICTFFSLIAFTDSEAPVAEGRVSFEEATGFIPYGELKITPLKSHDWGVAGREPLSYRELQRKLIAEEAKNLHLCRRLKTQTGGTHNPYYDPILQQFDELQDGRNG